MILACSPVYTFPNGRTAAYEPSVGVVVAIARVFGFVLYALEKEQQSANAVITPGVSE